MKRALVIMMVLALAAPLYADVEFVDTGGGVITWTSDGAAIVAMGLDVDMTSGEITAVAIDSFFDIYMDDAYDLEAGGGYSYGAGEPIAKQDEAGGADLPNSSFCISMGGLGGETEPLDPAPMAGTITFEGTGEGILAENALRGGVIDENGDQVATNLPIPFSIAPPECYEGRPDYAEWEAVGKPKCWCYPTQCEGDADGKTQGSPRGGGYYYVGSTDIAVLAGAWDVKEPGDGPGITSVVVNLIPGACADFDHVKQGSPRGGGYYRVGSADIAILAANWDVKEPGDGPGIATTCLPGNRLP